MSWVPGRAELAQHPGRALVGLAVALAAVMFLVHGFPPGMTFRSPMDVYPTAKYSRASLLPRRQVALYLALATPAGAALVRSLENQAFVQFQVAYDVARTKRSPGMEPITPEVRDSVLGQARAEVERSWANLRATVLVIDLLCLIPLWWLLWHLGRLASRKSGADVEIPH
jgi:hypothetical protein